MSIDLLSSRLRCVQSVTPISFVGLEKKIGRPRPCAASPPRAPCQEKRQWVIGKGSAVGKPASLQGASMIMEQGRIWLGGDEPMIDNQRYACEVLDALSFSEIV